MNSMSCAKDIVNTLKESEIITMQGVFKDVKAPNVYTREIDRSVYNADNRRPAVDNNVVICGFANKGPVLEPRWFVHLDDFVSTYGHPTNEAERYFSNAANEVITQGGGLIACRLPYDNNSYEHVTYCKYKVSDSLSNVEDSFPELQQAYPEIKKHLAVQSKTVDNGLMDFRVWDAYITGAAKPGRNEFIIVNTTGNKYVRDDYYKDHDDYTNQYLGIVPVIVSPLNALNYQTLLSVDDSDFSKYNLISELSTISDFSSELSNKLPPAVNQLSTTNFETQLSSESVRTESVGRDIIEYAFPQVTYDKIRNRSRYLNTPQHEQFANLDLEQSNTLNKTYLNQIGVVVCRMYANRSNEGRIVFDILESYVGSLDPNAVDESTGASIYIGNKINSASPYINFFSNVDLLSPGSQIADADIITIANQTIYSMGFFESDTQDKISYARSITNGLERTFKKLDDTRTVKIDLVVDAGISNIAQYIKQFNGAENSGKYEPRTEHIDDFILAGSTDMTPYASVRMLFEQFCRYTRGGDCMFITDSPRPLSLAGDAKIVRPSDPLRSVTNAILPKLKYIPVLNSCFAAGYATWFMVLDKTNRTYVWLPPSIKAVGRYIYTDAVAKPWYAPAGLNRGVIDNAYDISFNPNNTEAGVLYSNSWNYAVNTTFNGIIQEGQRTFQIKPTALDRVNVRRLMCEIEKRVAAISRRYLYEPLTTANLMFFENDVSKYLSKVQTGDGIEEYVVIADDTNNNANTIDNNELHCVIGVRPIKSIEYIFLTFVTTNQSVNVKESTMAATR